MLQPGSPFGSYEILARLGAGGMGAVYRARDRRLGREVALKVLPDELASNKALLDRFTLESRSATALNHPNIVTVYEVGEVDGVAYIAMELIDGRNLREMLGDGALPLRKLLPIAAQIADGLAAAHAKGIVHRDLKPENVMVAKSGFAKIVDFGLARVDETTSADDATMRMQQAHTQPGTVLGTVGYMSPEQASARPADFRSDQFSFGAILYEMVTGRRAFQKPTSVETLSAILREDPPPIEASTPGAPLPLRWIIERCLAKEPEERYGSTVDLARDLQRMRETASNPSQVALTPPPTRRRWLRALPLAAAVLFAGLLGLGAASMLARHPEPSFRRISFRRGYITSARFTTDGKTILYSAGWDGKPVHVYSTREETPESTETGYPDGAVLAVSRSGSLALALGQHYTEWFVRDGRLAEASIGGGSAPRELTDGVCDADYAPDGRLAIVRNAANGSALEMPIGKALYRTAGWISHARVAPDGQSIAFINHPVRGDDRGEVMTADLAGKTKKLTKEYASIQGLAWRRDGKEIWFTGSETGFFAALHGVTLDGRERLVYRAPGRLILHDIDASGRALVTAETPRVGAIVLAPGASAERDVSWLDGTFTADLSPDGRTVLLDEQGEGAGPNYSVYMRPTDGSPAVRLSDGFGTRFSPDGKRVLIENFADNSINLVPTGAGTAVRLTPPVAGALPLWPSWFPDGRRIYYALPAGDSMRLYIQNADGSGAHPISPPGFGTGLFPKPISPDGTTIALAGPEGLLMLLPVAGGPPRPVPGARPGEFALTFAPDGRTLFTSVLGELPPRIYRIDLRSGARTLQRELAAPDPAGIAFAVPMQVTPDGASYAYTYLRVPGDLFLVDGLR